MCARGTARWRTKKETMWHCDTCNWDGPEPARQELVGEGCGGVIWTLRVCPACGEEVYETVIPRPLPAPDRN